MYPWDTEKKGKGGGGGKKWFTKGLCSFSNSSFFQDLVLGFTVCWCMAGEPAVAPRWLICYSLKPPGTEAPDILEEVMCAWWGWWVGGSVRKEKFVWDKELPFKYGWSILIRNRSVFCLLHVPKVIMISWMTTGLPWNVVCAPTSPCTGA